MIIKLYKNRTHFVTTDKFGCIFSHCRRPKFQNFTEGIPPDPPSKSSHFALASPPNHKIAPRSLRYVTQNSYSRPFSQRKKFMYLSNSSVISEKELLFSFAWNSASQTLFREIWRQENMSSTKDSFSLCKCHLLKTLSRCAMLPRCWIQTLPASSGPHKQACACTRHGCISVLP